MRPPMVVPVNPVPNDPPRLLERLELMLPHALLFETAKEPFDDAVLLRGIRRDELLLQAIIPTGLPKPPALEDQAVVAPHGRRQAHGPQGSKARQARGFHGAFGLLRPPAPGELVANQFAIMTRCVPTFRVQAWLTY